MVIPHSTSSRVQVAQSVDSDVLPQCLAPLVLGPRPRDWSASCQPRPHQPLDSNIAKKNRSSKFAPSSPFATLLGAHAHALTQKKRHPLRSMMVAMCVESPLTSGSWVFVSVAVIILDL